MLKHFNMELQTALITGAGGLLGPIHAQALAEQNCNLIITDIELEKIESLQQNLTKDFPKCNIQALKMDVTSHSSIENVYHILQKGNISIDVLVNNAAVNPVESELNLDFRFEKFNNESFQREFEVGLLGSVLCCKIFGSHMANNKKGSIINIASDLSVISPNQTLYAKDGLPRNLQQVKPISYSIIKTGLIGMTKYLATYWASDNVRVNAISPGGVFDNQNLDFIEKISSLIPMGRMCRKEELAGAVQFLASNASSYVTGQNLIIDGGRSVW